MEGLKEKIPIYCGTVDGDIYFKKMLGVLVIFVLHLAISLAIDDLKA